jgi:hypothetical protein
MACPYRIFAVDAAIQRISPDEINAGGPTAG